MGRWVGNHCRSRISVLAQYPGNVVLAQAMRDVPIELEHPIGQRVLAGQHRRDRRRGEIRGRDEVDEVVTALGKPLESRRGRQPVAIERHVLSGQRIEADQYHVRLGLGVRCEPLRLRHRIEATPAEASGKHGNQQQRTGRQYNLC